MSWIKGKECIVTGSNSGICKETAIALARLGATIIMAVRDQERGEKARTEIVKQTGNGSVDLMICDLAWTCTNNSNLPTDFVWSFKNAIARSAKRIIV